jgi:hypothetical protein
VEGSSFKGFFRVKALKVDGRSEFYGEFEKECQKRG